MKKIILLITIITVLVGMAMLTKAQDKPTTIQHFEYVAIHYMGGDRVMIVFPDELSKLLSELTKYNRPKWADDRMFNLSVAVNYLAKQGYEPIVAGHFDVNDCLDASKYQ